MAANVPPMPNASGTTKLAKRSATHSWSIIISAAPPTMAPPARAMRSQGSSPAGARPVRTPPASGPNQAKANTSVVMA